MKKYILMLFIVVLIPFSATRAEKNKDFRLSSTQITPRVLSFVKENYIDQARLVPFEMLKGALDQIQKSCAEILVTFDQGYKFTLTVDKAVKKFSPRSMADLSDLWVTLREVYTFIEMHYHGTQEQQDIEYLAIDGMLEKLDPHSNMLTPKIFNEFKIGTKGKFGGIGIVIGSKEGELTVISPIEGTPAWRAGIKAQDKILQIGNQSTVNMTLTEAVELLRGDVGTSVTVLVERKGKPAPFNVTLKRAVINIESVKSTTIPVDGRSVGYIKVKNFQEDTETEFTKQLAEIKKAPNFNGLIIDLRNDPGGLLSQAVGMVDKFIASGVIVSTIGAGNRFIDKEVAKGFGTEPEYPVVVLVNEGSASAAEIVAGTLQSYKRALVIGSQTFGKGSVQTVYDLKDGSGLKLTIAEYLTAGKNSIQTVGVTPDIKLLPARIDKDKMDIVEDEHDTELSLEGHLLHMVDFTKTEPAYKMSFFEPVEKDKTGEEEEAKSRSEYSNKLDFSKDFAVRFASKIIAGAPMDSYEDLLKSAMPVVKKTEEQEQELMAAALTKYGIEWGKCDSSGKPQLQVSFELRKNGEPIKRAVAGEEVELALTAKNIGTGEFCKLVGISTSKESSIKNKEFVFGNLKPDVSKKWVSKYKVPKNLVSQDLPMTIKFHELGKNQPAEFQAILPVQGLSLPRFAVFYKLGEPMNVKVKESPMPIGKTMPLNVTIKNVGLGTATNAIAIIANPEAKGVFIDAGRVKIGKLEPGQSKVVNFKFHVEEELAKPIFELELTAADQDTYVAITKKIEFNTNTSTTTPPANQWYEGPKIAFNEKDFPIVTSAAKQHIEGVITDDREVKDYFIMVGEEKVAYSSNPQQTTSYAISADLPLKAGNNLITIVARDDIDLSSRYNFMIEKK